MYYSLLSSCKQRLWAEAVKLTKLFDRSNVKLYDVELTSALKCCKQYRNIPVNADLKHYVNVLALAVVYVCLGGGERGG